LILPTTSSPYVPTQPLSC